MKALTFFFGCALVTLAPTATAQSRYITMPVTDSVNRWQELYKVPVVAVGLIEAGHLKETKLFGKLDNGQPAPATTFFNMASVTKPIVSMLTLHLISAKHWEVDQPLAAYFVDPDVATNEWHKKLTTRMVLAHQTGLPNWRGNDPFKKMTFAYEPGTAASYSGEGYMYLGHALEHKFHKSLQQLADSLLFQPLGMPNTQFYWTTKLDESLYAGRHDRNGAALELEKWYEPNAANLLLTTIADYCTFGVSVLAQQGLSKRVYKEMITPQLPARHVRRRQVGQEFVYGLGWGVLYHLRHGEYALFHRGRNPGVNTIIMLLPKSKRGVIVFTNGENGMEVYNKIIRAALENGNELLERSNRPLLVH